MLMMTMSCITNFAVPDGATGTPLEAVSPNSMPVSSTVGAVLPPGPGLIVSVPEEKGLRPFTACGRIENRLTKTQTHAV